MAKGIVLPFSRVFILLMLLGNPGLQSLAFDPGQRDSFTALPSNCEMVCSNIQSCRRLESKIYPELQNPATMSRWPGKYYRQQELLELVDYSVKISSVHIG